MALAFTVSIAFRLTRPFGHQMMQDEEIAWHREVSIAFRLTRPFGPSILWQQK
jgi:hypothetical protein